MVNLTPAPDLPSLDSPSTFNDRALALFSWIADTHVDELEAFFDGISSTDLDAEAAGLSYIDTANSVAGNAPASGDWLVFTQIRDSNRASQYATLVSAGGPKNAVRQKVGGTYGDWFFSASPNAIEVTDAFDIATNGKYYLSAANSAAGNGPDSGGWVIDATFQSATEGRLVAWKVGVSTPLGYVVAMTSGSFGSWESIATTAGVGIADDAVTEAKVAAAAITLPKLGGDVTKLFGVSQFEVFGFGEWDEGNPITEIDLDADGSIVRIGRAMKSTTSEGDEKTIAALTLDNVGSVRTFEVFGFADPLATDVVLNYTGEVIEIGYANGVRDISGAQTDGASFEVFGFGAYEATDVELDIEGYIVGLKSRNIEKVGAAYVGMNAYPDKQFDGSSDVSWWDPDDVIIGAPGAGQSLEYCFNEDDASPISTTATYSGSALMPSFGVHIDGQRFTGVTDLIEANNGSARETWCSAFANHYIKQVYDAVSVEPQVLTWIAAQGSQPYSNLKAGSATGNDLINSIKDAQAYAASVGKTLIIPAIFMNHGQNGTDGLGGVQAYLAALQHWRSWIVGVVRSITGQAEDPIIMLTQIDAGLTASPLPDLAASNWYIRDPNRAQYLAGLMPGFAVSHSDAYQPRDAGELHCNNEGYYRQGMARARATYRLVNGEGHVGLFADNPVWRSTTVLDFPVSLNRGQALDIVTDEIVPAFEGSVETNYGLQLADAGGLLAASEFDVEIVDVSALSPAIPGQDRFVRVTFDSAPSGAIRWAFGCRNDANGPARTQITVTDTTTPIHSLTSGYDDREYLGSTSGIVPNIA
jgi:hypothetical protein